jgi:outer membrane protein TolC
MLLLPVFPKPAHAQNSAALTLQEAVQIALAQHPDVEKARAAADLIKGRIREVRAQAFPEVNFGANVIRWGDPSLLNPSGLDKFPEELRNALVPTSVNLFDYSVRLSPCKVETHARASEMRLTRPTTSRKSHVHLRPAG